MLFQILQDGFFAAIAAIGFSSISNPPRRTYLYCAITAAVGHSVRFLLMNNGVFHTHIIPASAIAAFAIGIVAVFLTRFTKSPAESCFFPALLPMIPGMYAYHTIEALLMCLYHSEEPVFNHYLYLLAYNGFTCTFIIIGMVVGATIPVFLLKRCLFRRQDKYYCIFV